MRARPVGAAIAVHLVVLTASSPLHAQTYRCELEPATTGGSGASALRTRTV